MKNIIKKIFLTFLVMLLILIPFLSYADTTTTDTPDLTINKSRHIYSQEGSNWDYGIEVIVPGTYTLDFYATNSATESDTGNKFEIYCDSEKIVGAAGVPWNENNTEEKLTYKVSLSVGKHKLSVKSVGENWEFSNIAFSLDTATSSGKAVPGTIKVEDKAGYYGGVFSDDNVYLEPGEFVNYKIAVKNSGTYKFSVDGKFTGTDGNRLVLRLDNAILGYIEHDEVTSDYTEVSSSFDLPEGTHYFEIYNDDGHYYLKSLDFSLVSKKTIAPIKRLTKEQYEASDTEGENTVNIESGLSIADATNRINESLDGIMNSFVKMLFSALQPIVDKFLELLSGLLTKQSGIIEKLVFMYIEWTKLWTRTWMFELLLILLRAIDALMNIFGIFAGTKPISVNEESTIFVNMLFEDQRILKVFWGIFVLGIALNIIFAIISVTRSIFSDEEEKALGTILKHIGKSLLTYVMVPVLVIFSVNLASVVLLKIDTIMTGYSGGNNLTFGNTLFMILSFGEETKEYKHCSEEPSFTDEARIDFYNNNNKYERSSNSNSYFYFSFLKVLGGVILCCYIILLLTLAIIMFVTRIFDLILLFITSPYFAATISLDGGERFADWRKLFIAKLVSGFGLVIMMKLFVGIVLPVITNGSIVFSTNTFINAGFMILILTAGCYAVFKSHNLIMKLIDPQSALAEMGVAEVAVGAAHEVANIVKSEATGGASKAAPSSGPSNEQKNILSK